MARAALATVTSPDTIQNKQIPSIRIPIRVVYNGKTIDAQAILDSGAEGVYCYNDFIAKHKIRTHPLERLLRARNVDGTLNKQGIIHHAAIL